MGFSSHSGRQARLAATSRQASPRPRRMEPDSSAPFQRTSSPTGSSCQSCHWGWQRGSGTQQRAGWTAPTQTPPGAGKGGRGRMRCLVYKSHLLTYTRTITCNACMCVCVCVCVPAQSRQLCQTLCDPIDCSPPGSSVRGISQARIRTLEWVVMPSSRGSSWPRDWTQDSCIVGRFFTTKSPGKPLVYKSTPSYTHRKLHVVLVIS